ncbi:MAG: hypothetical protein HY567_00770 [Candidatus Kerfeldbacteria bacterium]|nr:hypothetical protein [Candidatus Kerfeldbacteria bacterium]
MNPALRERILSRHQTLCVEGREYGYFVIQRSLPGAPRFFVGRDETSGYFIISDEIKGEFRELVLRHEMFEIGVLGGHGQNRCQSALFYELAHCPHQLLRDYLAYRLDMIQHLIAWVDDPQRVGQYPAERRREIERTLRRIKNLLATR